MHVFVVNKVYIYIDIYCCFLKSNSAPRGNSICVNLLWNVRDSSFHTRNRRTHIYIHMYIHMIQYVLYILNWVSKVTIRESYTYLYSFSIQIIFLICVIIIRLITPSNTCWHRYTYTCVIFDTAMAQSTPAIWHVMSLISVCPNPDVGVLLRLKFKGFTHYIMYHTNQPRILEASGPYVAKLYVVGDLSGGGIILKENIFLCRIQIWDCFLIYLDSRTGNDGSRL